MEEAAVDELSKKARALAAAIEPVAGQVYFSPECHAAYERLGFGPSPGLFAGVAMPDAAAYFTSRGSVMGHVPGEVVAAAFGVFNPVAVVPALDSGWSLTDPETISAARDEGACAQLVRVIGEKPDGVDRANELLARATGVLRPEGRPLYSGLASLDPPEGPVGRMWRLADMLREYRGDSHVNAWTAAGLDGCEISLLTEPYWGLPLRSYSRTRAWSDEDFDAAEERLAARGWLRGGTLTEEGRAGREQIEVATDLQCKASISAVGAELDELISLLGSWGAAVRSANGYPASGPQELAEAATGRR